MFTTNANIWCSYEAKGTKKSYYRDFCSTYGTTAGELPIGDFKSALTNWPKKKHLKSVEVSLPTITGGSESIHRKYIYCSKISP